MLLAPVYESFLKVRTQCLSAGGFVVGPIGETTAGQLFDYATKHGERSKDFTSRFAFNPMLPGAVYESHVSAGNKGGFHFIGLIDEIEINENHQPYRFREMKPGEGIHGEPKYDERMPAYVRFRVLRPVPEVIPGKTQLWPADLGQTEAILRHFRIGTVGKTALREAFDRLRLPSH